MFSSFLQFTHHAPRSFINALLFDSQIPAIIIPNYFNAPYLSPGQFGITAINAFFSYYGRSVARDEGHPYIGGCASNALKYVVRETYVTKVIDLPLWQVAMFGCMNGLAYEWSTDFISQHNSSYINHPNSYLIAPTFIETNEAVIATIIKDGNVGDIIKLNLVISSVLIPESYFFYGKAVDAANSSLNYISNLNLKLILDRITKDAAQLEEAILFMINDAEPIDKLQEGIVVATDIEQTLEEIYIEDSASV